MVIAMKKILLITSVMLVLGGLIFATRLRVKGLNPDPPMAMVSVAKDGESLLKQIRPYRTWTLVNPTPVIMNPRAAMDCVAAFPMNPHETRWASVYVNDKGSDAMKQDHPIFPEGSIIVKEKLRSELDHEPELLTVMIKRSKGFNPESRDWEYLVLDGPAEKILENARLSRCNECHEKYIYTDFVTMRYIKPKLEQ
jgi:hypothetical protein